MDPQAGCSVEDPTEDFYGPTLNKNGGAVSDIYQHWNRFGLFLLIISHNFLIGICRNVHQFGNLGLEMVRVLAFSGFSPY